MTSGSVNSIETFGLVDGPGIRTVVFLNGCSLRCKYCHNPEMWKFDDKKITSIELLDKIIRNKPYFKNNGGVTFSGGEPLLQADFLIEMCQLLKKEEIHIAIDTAGVGIGKYDKILENVDLVLLDIKHVQNSKYKDLVGIDMDKSLDFIEVLNQYPIPVWIRQVIVPGLMDNEEYLFQLNEFLQKIKNIERIDFLPYHKMGDEKYQKLKIDNPYLHMKEMDKEECNNLYQHFMNDIYKNH